ncbi:hypothetical protein OMO38_01025 [Chryseobacterium sp. 09-1422]|uniref:Uncharacterized protein n=1 Tax=Chryseobacterium kimseyorum TaxID=2984028 RepID=A0ABT3HTI7_9FLAO|nr:hypothetical protein [Chryseobacterium kimseyorum]MCW3167096.1 hypothetical protein [Chryseobacterium kimseyorum]
MRALYFLIFILFNPYFNAQEKIFGEYNNDFGEKLILKSNYTFEYYWNFDLASSWNIGTWEIDGGKNIYLKVNEIKDTLKSDNRIEMVLSSDKISNEITSNEYALNLISGGGQSRNLPPKKLFHKDSKLFTFSKTGKIQNKKIKSLIKPTVNLKPWFEK